VNLKKCLNKHQLILLVSGLIFSILIFLNQNLAFATNAKFESIFKNQQLSINEKTFLQNELIAKGTALVPSLIKVINEKNYSDQGKWLACFYIGKVMGKNATNYLNKLLNHPNWIIRLASLKTLLNLNVKDNGSNYAAKLKDESYLVRLQAIENIKILKLNNYAPKIIEVLTDKRNYSIQKGKHKRTEIIKSAIRALGELKYVPIEKGLKNMLSKNYNSDIKNDLKKSLTHLSVKNSP
jgi:HEAT repeat protein